MRIRVSLLALGLLLSTWTTLSAQEQPKKPIDIFRTARDFLQSGNQELAAETFKEFLTLKPADQDYLDIETKYGANSFQNLRNVPRWLPDVKKDADFKKTVIEGIIEGSMKANEKLLSNPARILRFVQNLGESREERDFAIAELNRAGDAVVPILIENLKINNSPEYRAGALTAVTRLSAAIVPGIIVAAENLPEELKVGLIRSLARRPDVGTLVGKADTNFTPYLWYLASSEQAGGLRDTGVETLRELSGDRSDRQQPDAELVKYATPMFERKGNFATFDSMKNRVKLWVWDAPTNNVKPVDLTKSQAEEQMGLKYLKWAIERRPSSDQAQELFLSLATERAVERANFGDLEKADPNVSQLLASAPASLLIGLLNSAMADNRTALAYGLTQALGNRAEKSAAVPEKREGSDEKRPAALVKALSYSDPRVQLSAAAALLKMPQVDHGANAKIVDVLKRAAGGDGAASGMGKALIVDPSAIRGDQVAALVRGVGYQSEVFGTAREMIKRINRNSDFDIILVDHHVVDPELKDVLAQLSANTNAGRRPILVVASPDKIVAPSIETQLLRLAVLIAVTETTELTVPPPYENDKRKTKEENEDIRKKNVQDRDGRLMRIAEGRIARMKRIVTAANLGTSIALETRLDLRLPQLALAALVAEYEPTPEFAPTLFRDLKNYSVLLRRQTELDKSLEGAPSDDLIRLISQLETALTPEMQKAFEQVLSRIDADELNLPRTPTIDPVTEATLKRLVSGYKGVTVIAEPFAVGSTSGSVKYGLAYDVQASIADPAQRPREASEKNAATKMAIDWLRRLAVGEQTGYDLTSAVPALRQALSNDEYAESAIEALSRIPVAAAQQDLARVSATSARSVAVRGKAADAAIRHIQANGKMTTPEIDKVVATAQAGETNAEIKSKLAILTAALSGKPGDLVNRIKGYTVPTAAPATPKPPMPMKVDETKPPVENKQ